MKRNFILTVFFLVLGLCLKPIVIETHQPVLLPTVEIEDEQTVTLLENRPAEWDDINVSFERIYLSEDAFSDKYGFRPYPWGQEIFSGEPEFLCDNSLSRTDDQSFKISVNSRDDVGALTVPDLCLKPIVKGGSLYYLSFWINYEVKGGPGIRLIQQFFREDDDFYPSYACYGPYITGSSNGEWVNIGLLVRAPEDAVRGDPVITISGVGRVNIDDAFFGEVKIDLKPEREGN